MHVKDGVPIETGAVLYEKSGMYCYQPLRCSVSALLISPSPVWNMSQHWEQFAALDRSFPWPQVFISRGRSKYIARENVWCVSYGGNVWLSWFWMFPAKMMRFLFPQLCWQRSEAIFYLFFQHVVFHLCKESVVFAIHLHSSLVSSIPHKKTAIFSHDKRSRMTIIGILSALVSE